MYERREGKSLKVKSPSGPGSRCDRWWWICMYISLIFQHAFYLSMRHTSAEVYILDNI